MQQLSCVCKTCMHVQMCVLITSRKQRRPLHAEKHIQAPTALYSWQRLQCTNPHCLSGVLLLLQGC
jgi:hypothetical protein